MEIFDSISGILLIILFFGGSIFIHELGHFLAARWRGLKIERFSIGFGPRLFGWTGKDGVDYRVSLFPLGGYVALPQLGSDTGSMELIEGKAGDEPLPPISYADKVIVSLAGVVFNVLFAFLLACVLWVTKRPVPPNFSTTTVGYVVEKLPGRDTPSPAFAAGLLPGDKITAIDDAPVDGFPQIVSKIALGGGRDKEGRPQVKFTVERDGKLLAAPILARPELQALNPSSGDTARVVGIGPASNVTIDRLVPADGPAARAGLRKGETILALDGARVHSLEHFRQLLDKAGERVVRLTVRGADGREREAALTPQFRTDKGAYVELAFREKGERRKILLVPVPDDPLADFSGDKRAQQAALAAKRAEPRKHLMVFDADGVPETSEFAGVASPGDILTSINIPGDKTTGDKGGLFKITTTAELLAAAARVKKGADLFFNGDSAKPLKLDTLEVREVAARKRPFIGIEISAQAELVRQSPAEQIRTAFQLTFDSIAALANRNTDVGVGQLMGVISIARTYYSMADDIRRILWFTLIININLAILNILPFPVLDGGHILLATIQRILGRPLPEKIVGAIQYVFIALFLGLMIWIVLYKDVLRWHGDALVEKRARIVQRYVFAPEAEPQPPATAPAKPAPAPAPAAPAAPPSEKQVEKPAEKPTPPPSK
ncbi:MAG: site-2 protease family protein [Puniceicoccales bacterium]|jgi:RIP metalloprotease RseP|nr:site-2 protease family protein [Puniceicoccales bacterium]